MEGYLKLKLFAFWFLLAGLIFLCVLAISTHSCVRSSPHAETRIDTVIVRDTIREVRPVVKEILTTRVDTVFVRLAGDTVEVMAELPIERKVYQTEDYKAVVEGFRPELVYLEVYRQTRYVDRVQMTPDTRRWGLGLQAGYGLSVQNGNVKAYPYVGVGVQYSLFRW